MASQVVAKVLLSSCCGISGGSYVVTVVPQVAAKVLVSGCHGFSRGC